MAGIDLECDYDPQRRIAQTAAGRAIPAGTVVVKGLAAFSVEAAQAFVKRGDEAILVRNDVATSDVAGIAIFSGLLTATGGRTSHAAVVTRQMGKVRLVGCSTLQVDEKMRSAKPGDSIINVGDSLCLDGDAGTIWADSLKISTRRPEELLKRVKQWRKHVNHRHHAKRGHG